jgi:putative ABC transport system substrate-binding protein
MRRREFISLLGGAAAWPVAARAQRAGMPVIGFLRNTSPEQSASLLAALRKGLNEVGYVGGENVAIEYRWGGGQQESLRGLADDLIGRNVVLIVAGGDAAIFAAKSATRATPIVFATGDDPVKLGLVSHLNRPEANLTGVSFLSNTLRTKQLELLHELVPKTTLVAMLANPKIPITEDHVKEQQQAARALGVSLEPLMAGSEGDLEPAFAKLDRAGAGALYIDGDSLFTGLDKQVVALTIRYKVPTIFNQRESVVAGGLMSYGASITDAYRHAGVYAGRILKGEKPGDLPVMQATKFDLVINRKAAKALGVEIPLRLFNLADEVIE